MRTQHTGRPAHTGACLLATLLLTACAVAPQPITNDEIASAIDRMQVQNDQLKADRAAARQRGIRALSIANPTAPLDEQRVTARLDNADLGAVIDGLKLDYVLAGRTRLSGRVTARFSDLPMPDALHAILLPAGLQAAIDSGLVTISPLPAVDLQFSEKDDYVMRKRVLRYADTRALEEVLGSLLLEESDDDDDDDDDSSYDTSYDDSDDAGDTVSPSKSLTYAALHAENAILLKGPSAQVRNALQVLDAIDADNGHLMIEAMVLEFSATDLLQIGTRISNGASGNFSDISIDWGSMVGETISFASVAGAANTRAFQAAISLLLQNEEARILARPYMAAIPGYQAKIDVAEDRYVTTFTENSGDVTLEPVTSGIMMTMTPFLLPEGLIRMDIDVSVSQFIPTLDNVQLARSRNDATTTVRIPSGETLVIGGLMAEQSSASMAGVPGARTIPGLGFLFGERKTSNAQRRVLIYLTPYLWEPGMDTPSGLTGEAMDFVDQQDQL